MKKAAPSENSQQTILPRQQHKHQLSLPITSTCKQMGPLRQRRQWYEHTGAFNIAEHPHPVAVGVMPFPTARPIAAVSKHAEQSELVLLYLAPRPTLSFLHHHLLLHVLVPQKAAICSTLGSNPGLQTIWSHTQSNSLVCMSFSHMPHFIKQCSSLNTFAW